MCVSGCLASQTAVLWGDHCHTGFSERLGRESETAVPLLQPAGLSRWADPGGLGWEDPRQALGAETLPWHPCFLHLGLRGGPPWLFASPPHHSFVQQTCKQLLVPWARLGAGRCTQQCLPHFSLIGRKGHGTCLGACHKVCPVAGSLSSSCHH